MNTNLKQRGQRPAETAVSEATDKKVLETLEVIVQRMDSLDNRMNSMQNAWIASSTPWTSA